MWMFVGSPQLSQGASLCFSGGGRLCHQQCLAGLCWGTLICPLVVLVGGWSSFFNKGLLPFLLFFLLLLLFFFSFLQSNEPPNALFFSYETWRSWSLAMVRGWLDLHFSPLLTASFIPCFFSSLPFLAATTQPSFLLPLPKLFIGVY